MSRAGHRKMTGMVHDMGDKGDLRNTTSDMRTSFYWGKRAVILFADWPGDQNLGMFLLALGLVFVLATAAEALSAALDVAAARRAGVGPMKAKVVQAALHAFSVGTAYLVMLSVMSFNAWIFVAAVGGHTLGYFLVKARAQAILNNQADPKI